uniref:Rho-GAP domain-containing protein n=1 Tax=Trichuris muris TaxID=70415 RepID=A0A5S6Q682_TRIMR
MPFLKHLLRLPKAIPKPAQRRRAGSRPPLKIITNGQRSQIDSLPSQSTYNKSTTRDCSALALSCLRSLPYVFDDGMTLTVPEFLIAAFTFLEERFLDHEGIFRKAGMYRKVKAYKVLFRSPDKQNVYSLKNLSAFDLCDLIKLFFRELEEPLLTVGLQGQFLRFVDANTSPNVKTKRLLQLCHALPARHRETLAFLMRKLSTVAEHQAENKMDVRNIATVFALVVFRDSESTYLPKNGQALADLMSASKLDIALKTEVIQLLIKACRSIGVRPSSERAAISAGVVDQPYRSGGSVFKVPEPVRHSGRPDAVRNPDKRQSALLETRGNILAFLGSSVAASDRRATRRRSTSKKKLSAMQMINAPAFKPPLVQRTAENKFSKAINRVDRKNAWRNGLHNRSNSDRVSGNPNMVHSIASNSVGSRRLCRGRLNTLKAGLSGQKPNSVASPEYGKFSDQWSNVAQMLPPITMEADPSKIHSSKPRALFASPLDKDEFTDSDLRKASLLSRKEASNIDVASDFGSSIIRPSIAFIRKYRKGIVRCAVRSYNQMAHNSSSTQGRG